MAVEGKPLVSLIMPVYNREAFLDEAVGSVLSQTYGNFELIVADDGSEDGSASKIKAFAEREGRIQPVFLDHGGIPKTLNAAIQTAKGDFIAYADSDDISLPRRLAQQIRWMRTTGADICGCQAEVFGTRANRGRWRKGINWLPTSPEAIRKEMIFRIAVWRGAMMIKAEVQKAHPFDETLAFTDCDWPMKMARKYTMTNTPEVLIRVNRHGGNTTSAKIAAFARGLLKTRFQYFHYLFPNTPLDDYLAVCRLADGAPLTGLKELETAGRWAVRLADCPETKFRHLMRRRWQNACDRSRHLGEAAVREICRKHLVHMENNSGSFQRKTPSHSEIQKANRS